MGISFAQVWALLLLVPALGGAALLWYRARRGLGGLRGRAILGLRLLILTLLVLALAAPSLRYIVNRQAVVFVADLSSSVERHQEWVEAFIRQAMASRGADDQVGIVATGQDPLVEWPLTERTDFQEFQSAVEPDFTNLSDALRLAAALLPQDARRRVVILSDGRQNLGNAAEQARFLRAQGIQVDVVPLEGLGAPEALVVGVEVPSSARQGELVPVDVQVQSTHATTAILRLSVDGSELARQEVTLEPGESRFAFQVTVDSPGFRTLRATLEAEEDTILHNNRADAFINVHGPPAVLVVEERPGAGANVAQALRATGLMVAVRPVSLFPETLEELGQYAATVLVDVPAEALSQRDMEVLRAAVRDLGRGLVAVGGGRSFTMGDYQDTPLEEALPVISQVPERKEKGKVALVLVIDKSGSMASPGSDGVPKVEMAKEAAALALEELEAYDLAGVVAFDSANWWLVPLQGVGDNSHLEEMQDSISRLTADGGTDIYPAVLTAYQTLAGADAPRRHMVLLTDGIAPMGDYQGLLVQMEKQDITLSTIAVGTDSDVALLQWLAEQGEGRFYYTDRARDIPQILTKETRLAARHAIVEEPTTPLVAGSSPVLQVTGGQFPSLGGYVTTLPKNAARMVLVSPKGDPLLAQWQFGLGRAIAWTSDSEGRWTSGLNSWDRAGAFWAALVDWTLPLEEAPFQIRAQVEGNTGHLVVEGEVQEGASLTARIVGPDFTATDVPLKATAPGRSEAQFPVDQQGSYLVQVVERGPQGEQRTATGGLVVPYSPEYRQVGGDPGLLEQVAAITGGGVLRGPEEAFGPGLPPAYGDVPLTWWLLLAATLLLPLDIALRRLNLRPTEALAWVAAAKAKAARRFATQEAVAPAPAALKRVRQRRTGRPRVEVTSTQHPIDRPVGQQTAPPPPQPPAQQAPTDPPWPAAEGPGVFHGALAPGQAPRTETVG